MRTDVGLASIHSCLLGAGVGSSVVVLGGRPGSGAGRQRGIESGISDCSSWYGANWAPVSL
jgi:hypothetical protein